MMHAVAILPHRRPSPGGDVVIHVEFEARNGRRWSAIGGGASLDEAIAFARDCTPVGRYGRVVRIEDLYGE